MDLDDSISEHHNDAVILIDNSGTVIAMNPAAERISGYTCREFQDLVPAALFSSDQAARCAEAFRRALDGELHELETEIIRKNGRQIALRLTGGPAIIKGDVSGLLLMARESTRRRQMPGGSTENQAEPGEQVRENSTRLQDEIARRVEVERQLRLLASALNMAEYRERERLAQILHDSLQQLLVGIKYCVDEIEKTPAFKKPADEIRVLVNNALEISRSLTTELSPPALHQGLVSALQWLAGWMNQRLGLAVDLRLEDMPPVSREVEVFIFQSIRELLLNAVKHAGVTSARVHVVVDDRDLHVAVEDDGTGFDPGQVRFDPGSSGGFGLVSIKERIALLGGSLEMKSTPGSGSRFRLSIPRHPISH